MKFCFKQLLPLLAVVLIALCVAWHNGGGASSSVTVTFHNKVGNKDLVLFDETYTNQFNEPFVVQRFRYYISNVVLIDANGQQKNLNDFYRLVDEADSSSKQIVFNTSGLQQIASIEFVLGVDSIRNVSGIQVGDLDPMKGMFWTWNSGYIFAKLEGKSDSSHAPSHYFSYHVGGYKQKENALRKIKLSVPASMQAAHAININADVLKWFQAIHDNPIAQSPVCHQAGSIAVRLADNYANMFSIAAVK